jgi:type II secretory pathway predicted ATPase ExeA
VSARQGSSGDGRPFPYIDYVHARNALLEALHAGPRLYALVLGASGMGKTCLVNDVSVALDRRRHHVVYVAACRASIVGIVRLLACKLHLRWRRSHLETVVALAETMAAQTMHWVLWLDDADQVAATTLAQLRILVEAVPAAAPLFSVVLSGPAALLSRLETPGLFALRRRFALHCTLAGLRRNELDGFLEHRFGAAGAERVQSSIRDELFERTQAAPALLDRVVRNLLHQHPQGAIDEDEIRAILDSAGL